ATAHRHDVVNRRILGSRYHLPHDDRRAHRARMTTMTDPAPKIRRLGEPGDLGWVVMAHGEVYASEFGWDTNFEALVASIVADYAAAHDPDREAAWIAERDGERVGCVFCVAKDDTTAQLRILLVDPVARGQRLGARLV